MMNLFLKWGTCQKAPCNTSVLLSVALRKKSISSQAVCRYCDRLRQQQTAGTWKISMLQRFVLQHHICTIPHNSVIEPFRITPSPLRKHIYISNFTKAHGPNWQKPLIYRAFLVSRQTVSIFSVTGILYCIAKVCNVYLRLG